MRIFTAGAVALLVAFGGAIAGEREHDHPQPPAIDDARFEFLKQLEGIWVGESDSDELPDNVVEFRVTAGGTAIEEREFAGTPMEMLTVYHMDGDDLVATHYCMLGNQPRVTAAPKVENRGLDFACSGTPGNAESHDDEHVHGWSLQLAADGKLHYGGQLIKAGTVTETPAFVLTRQARTASR